MKAAPASHRMLRVVTQDVMTRNEARLENKGAASALFFPHWLHPLEIGAERAVIAPCLDRAGAGFLQMTNTVVSPVASAALQFCGDEIARVWSQFPTVQTWRYRRASRTRATS